MGRHAFEDSHEIFLISASSLFVQESGQAGGGIEIASAVVLGGYVHFGLRHRTPRLDVNVVENTGCIMGLAWKVSGGWVFLVEAEDKKPELAQFFH